MKKKLEEEEKILAEREEFDSELVVDMDIGKEKDLINKRQVQNKRQGK